jgi:hypothetical protein
VIDLKEGGFKSPFEETAGYEAPLAPVEEEKPAFDPAEAAERNAYLDDEIPF